MKAQLGTFVQLLQQAPPRRQRASLFSHDKADVRDARGPLPPPAGHMFHVKTHFLYAAALFRNLS